MTLQYKTWHCNGILLGRFDVSFWYHSWQVCTYFCVCKCLLFQFFCLKNCKIVSFVWTHTHTHIVSFVYIHTIALWLSTQWLCVSHCGYNRNGTLRHIVFKIEYILCPSCVCEIWVLCVSWITSDDFKLT